MFIVVYRPHGHLISQTQYLGPFADESAAYDHLCYLPAIGIYNDDEHEGQHGCKFIAPLSPAIQF